MRGLSPVACAKLVGFFELVSLPKWLLAGPRNHYSAFYILEIVNNQLTYQWEGAPALVVNLLRVKDSVKRLEELEVVDTQERPEGQWLPDTEWLQSWKGKLDLGPLKVLVGNVYPKIDAYLTENPSASPEELETIVKRCTLVGLLQQPQITVRTLEINREMDTWLSVYTWVSAS